MFGLVRFQRGVQPGMGNPEGEPLPHRSFSISVGTTVLGSLLAVSVGAVLLHWGIGWEATVLAGVAGGAWTDRGHWLVGAVGVGLGWAVFVLYTVITARPAFRVLLDTLGALAGNIPGEAVVGLTVLVGALLGGLGAGIGRLLRLLVTDARGEASV